MTDFQALKNLADETTEIAVLEDFIGGTLHISAETALGDIPQMVRIRLISRPGPGSYLRTEIWLPAERNWNGRFICTGNGAMAGGMRYDNLTPWIHRGYAVANSDLGTSRGEASGEHNPDVWADFGWRGTHLMAELGKKAILLYYGRPQHHSYFAGRSTGGEQAFAAAEKFPEDFDGIYAGVAAMNRTMLHTYFIWLWVHLRRPEGPVFTTEETEAVGKLAVRYFQEKGDGEPGDIFITDPWHGDSTVEDFVAYVAKNMPELTALQLDTLRAVFGGPVNPRTGKRIYCGMPIGAGTFGSALRGHMGEKNGFLYPFHWAFGMDYDVHNFDFDRDVDRLNEALASNMNGTDADLRPFGARGGKLITYSGTADSYVPYQETASFMDRAAKYAGGYDKLGEYCRFFILPGRDHSGGPGANRIVTPGEEKDNYNAFSSLIRWVEEGIAPDVLSAVSYENDKLPGKKAFVRPLYPYGIDERCKIHPGNVQGGSEYV